MKAWHNFWFWYHTSIGMNFCWSVNKWLHHSNRAEIHELAVKNMGWMVKRIIRKGKKFMQGHSYSNCGWNSKGYRFSWTTELDQARHFNENDVGTANFLASQSGGKVEFKP